MGRVTAGMSGCVAECGIGPNKWKVNEKCDDTFHSAETTGRVRFHVT